MKTMMGEHIKELVGEDEALVIVIADSEVDINTSNIQADDIIVEQFSRFNHVRAVTKEDIPMLADAKKGVYIQVTDTLTKPLHIVCESSEETAQYVYLDIADDVEVTIIEHSTVCACGCSIDHIQLPMTLEVNIGSNSKIDYYAFDTSSLELQIQRFFAVAHDTHLQLSLGMFGRNNTSDNYVALTAAGAASESKMMMYVPDGAKQRHTVKMFHLAPNTVSNMINHGVVSGKALGEFTGIGYIENGAHQSDAQQESRIMALGEKSEAYVHPILLIDEYDVMAGHAGSVGRVSDEALFYLQSRGLTKHEAQLLVTEGFLRPVVENISDEHIKKQIEKVIHEKVGIHHGLA